VSSSSLKDFPDTYSRFCRALKVPIRSDLSLSIFTLFSGGGTLIHFRQFMSRDNIVTKI
jgi:hypothetical protein